MSADLPQRFWAKIETEVNTGCWLWSGSVCNGGYGRVRFDGGPKLAHRVVYTLLVGPVPEGLDLDHLCRVRSCVNPNHLEPVTRRENTLRGEGMPAQRAKRTHCPQGHPYDEANTCYCIDGKRYCRACGRNKQARRKARIRMEAVAA